MDVFGDQWKDHPAKIAANWRRLVREEDVVLLPGDFSWAMRLPEAEPDLRFLAELPGRKILIRGNHDYWWASIAKVRAALPAGVFAIQNDHLVVDGFAICGSRGWNLPNGCLPGDDSPKHFARERNRLEISLASAPPDLPKIAMLHFPPTLTCTDDPGFTDILEAHGVQLCVYGHLHGKQDHRLGIQGERNGVQYLLCAADAVNFAPVPLPVESIASTR